MEIADLLSHFSCTGPGVGKPISTNKFLNQMASQIPFNKALNSASALDKATSDCFLLFHVTKFLPRNEQYASVELLSTMDPPKSASVKTSSFSPPFLL